jgi:hypothetical protein
MLSKSAEKYLMESIREYSKRRVVALFFIDKIDGPSLGTGNIMEIQTVSGKKILTIVTNFHVAHPFLASGSKGVAAFPNGKRIAYQNFHVLSHGTLNGIDIAIMNCPISSEFYFKQNQIPVPYALPKKHDMAMHLFGYPATYAKQVNMAKFSIQPFSFWTSLYTGKRIRPAKRFEFFLDYPNDPSQITTNCPTGQLQNPKGMSGAFVLFPRNFIPGKIWSPDDMDIMGINYMWQPHSYMIAIKSPNILNLIAKIP